MKATAETYKPRNKRAFDVGWGFYDRFCRSHNHAPSPAEMKDYLSRAGHDIARTTVRHWLAVYHETRMQYVNSINLRAREQAFNSSPKAPAPKPRGFLARLLGAFRSR